MPSPVAVHVTVFTASSKVSPSSVVTGVVSFFFVDGDVQPASPRTEASAIGWSCGNWIDTFVVLVSSVSLGTWNVSVREPAAWLLGETRSRVPTPHAAIRPTSAIPSHLPKIRRAICNSPLVA